jgi:cytoskeletal protein RodZ
MTVFCFKNLPPAVRLGERLKGERERQGFSWNDVTVKTRLPQKFLEAMESGAFSELPKSKGYRLAYVKEYAEALGLNRDEIVRQMIKEAGLEDAPHIHPQVGIKRWPFSSLMGAARTILSLSAVALLIGYLAWQVAGIIEPPHLSIFTPDEGTVVTDPSVVIHGEAGGAARLTVNGQDIMVNEQGTFSAAVDLTAGVNTISASKKYGKTTTLVRHIVVRPSKAVGLNAGANSDKVGL